MQGLEIRSCSHTTQRDARDQAPRIPARVLELPTGMLLILVRGLEIPVAVRVLILEDLIPVPLEIVVLEVPPSSSRLFFRRPRQPAHGMPRVRQRPAAAAARACTAAPGGIASAPVPAVGGCTGGSLVVTRQ